MLSGLLTATKGEMASAIRCIIELKKELVGAGYNSGEVDYLVTIHAGNRSLTELDLRVLQEIEEALHRQLRLAEQAVESA
ncbi:MAG: hypothetical protein PHC60_09225 [Heliobacteriaceae bacterium]|nr:hypothetical protein [Heliobacteriaceae bacterium]MDD4588553.1 hypothetical protein [Heliobacteriaceae bacterium]